MYIDFSSLFHQSSKDRSGQGRVHIPLDPSEWPPEWKTIRYKTYPRFPRLPLADDRQGHFWDLMRRRSSSRDFTKRALTHQEISLLLKYSCGILGESPHHRAQPSGGQSYPIEMYPLIFVSGDIPSGVYHYNVKDHALDTLLKHSFSKENIANLFTPPWTTQASIALILTGVFSRNQMKYGERGYRQILIEVGAIVQNIYLTATELDIKCCVVDGVREPNIEQLLDVDGYAESAICSVVLG